jgi:c-di-GMP-binding flagellar brake protein YcgR
MSHTSGVGSESRRWARYEIDCRVKIVSSREGKKQVNYGRAQDMSFGGMMLTAPFRFHEGERVELEFLPPNMSDVLRLTGVIRQQIGGYSYGVEFRDVTDRQRKMVQRLFEVLHVLDSLK